VLWCRTDWKFDFSDQSPFDLPSVFFMAIWPLFWLHVAVSTVLCQPCFEKKKIYRGIMMSLKPPDTVAKTKGKKPPPTKRQAAHSWAEFAQSFRVSALPLPSPWGEVFEPLRTGRVDNLVVVGQMGQSLDGRIATVSGHSKYVNGPAGLVHLHKLRSLVDAVVVGVSTAIADDPKLTVRRVEGPNPARVVIDPNGRLAAQAKLFVRDGVRRLVIIAKGTDYRPISEAEVIALPATEGRIAPSAILKALAAEGFHRILIEGGANTVSNFLAAGCLDRLHLIVAPIIIGSGRASFILPPIQHADEAIHIRSRSYQLEDETLFDCDLSNQRIPVGPAKIST
jgi:diaminohydroxyphosphoribosylaminopyrimidine deaminase / 5-amino-6-(5-phosphoribosylamino)uracil reductase